MATPQRWTTAFDTLAAVEATLGLGRAVPVPFGVHGACAMRRQLRPELLPADLREEAIGADDGEGALVAVGADLVRIGKFDVEDHVRLRAFYIDGHQVPLALRLQGHVREEARRGARRPGAACGAQVRARTRPRAPCAPSARG